MFSSPPCPLRYQVAQSKWFRANHLFKTSAHILCQSKNTWNGFLPAQIQSNHALEFAWALNPGAGIRDTLLQGFCCTVYTCMCWVGAVGFVNDIYLSLFHWDELNLLPGNSLEPKERVPLAAKIRFILVTENSRSEKEMNNSQPWSKSLRSL